MGSLTTPGSLALDSENADENGATLESLSIDPG